MENNSTVAREQCHVYFYWTTCIGKRLRNGKEKWTQGYVIRRSGNVIYDVDVQSSIWVRHTNQLHYSDLF